MFGSIHSFLLHYYYSTHHYVNWEILDISNSFDFSSVVGENGMVKIIKFNFLKCKFGLQSRVHILKTKVRPLCSMLRPSVPCVLRKLDFCKEHKKMDKEKGGTKGESVSKIQNTYTTSWIQLNPRSVIRSFSFQGRILMTSMIQLTFKVMVYRLSSS